MQYIINKQHNKYMAWQLAKVLATEPLSRESKVKPIPQTMDFSKQKAS